MVKTERDMTQEELTRLRIELTADILKTLIQEKLKHSFTNSVLESSPDYNHQKRELVSTATEYANRIINSVLDSSQ